MPLAVDVKLLLLCGTNDWQLSSDTVKANSHVVSLASFRSGWIRCWLLAIAVGGALTLPRCRTYQKNWLAKMAILAVGCSKTGFVG